MTGKHIFKIIGNGDSRRGKKICTALARRVQDERAEHPVFALDPFDACTKVTEALVELYDAEAVETSEHYADKALGVMAKVTRAYNREWILSVQAQHTATESSEL